MRKFLRNAGLIIAGSLYIWALIFLLKSDNWVGISALTTMILAIAAFWAIWQNRTLQISERKERLLNEIIEWATEITILRSGSLFNDITLFEDTTKSALQMTVKIAKMISDLSGLAGRNTYILSISSFNSELKNPVDELVKELLKYIGFLDGWCTKLTDDLAKNEKLKLDDDDVKKGDDFESSIKRLAVEVVKEATKIKTKDIS